MIINIIFNAVQLIAYAPVYWFFIDSRLQKIASVQSVHGRSMKYRSRRIIFQ